MYNSAIIDIEPYFIIVHNLVHRVSETIKYGNTIYIYIYMSFIYIYIYIYVNDEYQFFNIIPCGEFRLPKKRWCPGYDIKLHLVVRLQFWSSGEF